MDEDLLPIGRFARLSRLSVKQLRHYDELGLLAPAHVDAFTGYRYYRREQARRAMAIGLLRSLDVPLAVVGEVLSGASAALEGVRTSLESELERRRRTLSALERVMAEGLPAPPVRLVREESLRVASTGEHVAGEGGIGRATSAAVGRLLAAAAPAPPVRLIGLFPLDLDDPIEVRAALVLPGGAVPAGLDLEVLPGGGFACATHVGPYEQISLTAHALLAWCAEHGCPVSGPLREVYVSDPATTAPERLVTHLMICVEE
ncbi:MerR family transcriptional regulator [Nonomuraea longicatena]|uniref:MerR family transcriptional regulator n=1 Tax=Nonomuraea longicatena TaxID=83682 RepID=A0ABP4AR26_9ACTN